MAYKPWNKEMETELVRLAVLACKLAGEEEIIIKGWWIANSLNNRPCISRHDPRSPNHAEIAFSIYPGQPKVVKKRLCMFEVLPMLRSHPPLVLDMLSKI